MVVQQQQLVGNRPYTIYTVETALSSLFANQTLMPLLVQGHIFKVLPIATVLYLSGDIE